MTAKTPEPSPESHRISESRPASAASSTPSVPEQPSKASAIPPEKSESTQAAPAEPATSSAAPEGTATPAQSSSGTSASDEPPTTLTAPTVPTKATSTTTPAAKAPAAKAPAAKVAAQVPAKVPARPATPPPLARPRRANGSGGAAVVAVLSLLFAIGATAVAVYALDVAREAKSIANIAMGADQATGQSPATSTPLPVSTPSPTATPGPLFVAEMQQVQTRIPPAQGCASVYFDVDSLRIGVEEGHEFYLSSCVGPLAFRVDRVSGVASAPSEVTAQECSDRIARSPSLSETVLPVQVGMIMCVLTSGQVAEQQGIPQKIGIVEVRAINQDRSVDVAVSTFRMPT